MAYVSIMDYEVSASFTWLNGLDVTAYLDWDDEYYYLWFGMTRDREDYAEYDLTDLYDETEAELQDIGKLTCASLDHVNQVVRSNSGDDVSAVFFAEEHEDYYEIYS